MMQLCFLGIAAALCAVLALWFLSNYKRLWNELVKLSKIPGPKQHWLLGNLPDFLKGRSTHMVMYNWVQEHGPIFRIRVLWTTLIVVTDPSVAYRVYKPGRESYQKFLKFYKGFNYFVNPHLSNILTSPSNDYWRAVRRSSAQAFTMSNIKTVLPHLCDLTKKVAVALKDLGPQATVDIDNVAQRLTIDVIGHFGFNQELGATNFEEHKELRVVKETLSAMQSRMNPLNRWFPWRKEAMAFWSIVKEYDSMCTYFVDSMLKHPPPAHTLASYLVKTIDPKTGQPLTFDQLKAEVSIFLVAGFETTAHTIGWTLFLLALNPEAEHRVAAELSSLGLLSEAGGAEPRDPCWDDLSKIPYLNAVINESMRMMPVAAGGSPRVIGQDMEILGHKLPAGSVLSIPFYAVHNSPHNWPEPDVFKPERWLDAAKNGSSSYSLNGSTSGPLMGVDSQGLVSPHVSNGNGAMPAPITGAIKSLSSDKLLSSASIDALQATDDLGMTRSEFKKAQARGFFPFSMGARDCVGQSLAMLELRVTLMMLLGRFRFQLAPESGGKQAVLDSAKVLVTLKPVNGMLMNCIPRTGCY